jgi:hypothetical protein
MSDLRHEFIPCTLPQCAESDEHCGYLWCGAPKDHSLHEPPAVSEPESGEQSK